MHFLLLLSYCQPGVLVLHIVIALKYFTLVCNVISVLVQVVNCAMTKVDRFGKCKSFSVQLKFIDWKDARNVALRRKGEANLSFLDVQWYLYSNEQKVVF